MKKKYAETLCIRKAFKNYLNKSKNSVYHNCKRSERKNHDGQDLSFIRGRIESNVTKNVV